MGAVGGDVVKVSFWAPDGFSHPYLTPGKLYEVNDEGLNTGRIVADHGKEIIIALPRSEVNCTHLKLHGVTEPRWHVAEWNDATAKRLKPWRRLAFVVLALCALYLLA